MCVQFMESWSLASFYMNSSDNNPCTQLRNHMWRCLALSRYHLEHSSVLLANLNLVFSRRDIAAESFAMVICNITIGFLTHSTRLVETTSTIAHYVWMNAGRSSMSQLIPYCNHNSLVRFYLACISEMVSEGMHERSGVSIRSRQAHYSVSSENPTRLITLGVVCWPTNWIEQSAHIVCLRIYHGQR